MIVVFCNINKLSVNDIRMALATIIVGGSNDGGRIYLVAICREKNNASKKMNVLSTISHQSIY